MRKSTLAILVGAGILLAVLGLWFLYWAPSTKLPPEPTRQPLVSPRVLNPQTQKIKNQLVATDKKVGDLVLEKNNQFEIIYLISNDQFMVRILTPPFAAGKTAAENWFLAKGFKALDLCLLKITFAAPSTIQTEGSSQEAVPTGCPAG